MLDRIRNVIAPTAITAEIEEIQGQLAKLEADREDLRLEAGRAVVLLSLGSDSTRESDVRKMHVKMAGLDGQIAELRRRRRDLAELTAEPTQARAALVSVAMPPEARRASKALDDARTERADLLARMGDGDEANARKMQPKLAAIDEQIVVLRKARATALLPYNVALHDALQPIILEAAGKLLAAAGEARAALAVLMEAATIAPPVAPGMGNGLAAVIGIDQRPLMDAETFARTLLRDSGPAHEGASE